MASEHRWACVSDTSQRQMTPISPPANFLPVRLGWVRSGMLMLLHPSCTRVHGRILSLSTRHRVARCIGRVLSKVRVNDAYSSFARSTALDRSDWAKMDRDRENADDNSHRQRPVLLDVDFLTRARGLSIPPRG